MNTYSFALVLALLLSTYVPANATPAMQGQGLIDSIWTGDVQSGDGTIKYIFKFTQGALKMESTCYIAEISSTLKSDLVTIYSENGNIAELKSGLTSTIPAGEGSCFVNFPVGLKFELDQDKIFIEYNGDRRLTKLKRLSQPTLL